MSSKYSKIRTYSLTLLVIILVLNFVISESIASSDECNTIFRKLLPKDSNNTFLFTGSKLKTTKAAIVDFRDVTSHNLAYKINNLDSNSLVLIDNATLSNKAAMGNIKNSKARFCIKSPTGINRLKNALGSEVNDFEVIALIPRTKKEVKNIFGVEGEDARIVLKQMKKTERYFKEIDNQTILNGTSNSETMAEMLSRQILGNSDTKKTYLIVGHNEKGNLKFPDGSTATINEIYKNINKAGQQGIVLSCQTVDSSYKATMGVFTTRRLEFENIAMSIKKTAKWAKDGESKTVGDFTVMLEQSLKNADEKKERNVKIIYASVTGTGSFIIVAFVYVITDD